MLELQAVTRTFRGGGGVREVSERLRPGEITALVGLNGAGKTTLMRVALGMLRPDSGAIRIDGQPVTRATNEMWRRVGHLVDTPLAYPELTSRENLEVAALLRGVSLDRVDAALTEWSLGRYAERRARRLSMGNRQRVGLAAALLHDPMLVILDEPTNALDPSGVLILRDALQRRAAAGAAVLVSSHHLDEVARIADRIVLMNGGRLIGELDPHGADIERAFFERVRLDDEARLTQRSEP